MNKVIFLSNKDDWETPQDFYDKLNDEFHFTLDPCADENNHKCEKYFSRNDNGLLQDWGGHTVFVNPPYGAKSTSDWIRKCSEESHKPHIELQRFTTGTITARTGGAASVGTYVAESQQYAQEMIYQRPRGNNSGGLHDIAPTVTSNCYEHNNVVIKQICNIVEEKNFKNPQRGRVYDTSGIAPCLNCMGGGGLEPKIAIPCITPDRANKRQNGRRFKNNNDPMFTLTAQDRHGVVTGGIYTGVSPEYQSGPLAEKSRCLKSNKADAGVIIYNGKEYFIRKLTPLECWRLQGWDDESFFRAFFLDKDLAHKFNTAYQRHKQNPVRLMHWAFNHQKMSDSQLYKQAGNGVTVTVIQRIAEKFSLEE